MILSDGFMSIETDWLTDLPRNIMCINWFITQRVKKLWEPFREKSKSRLDQDRKKSALLSEIIPDGKIYGANL